MKTITLWALGIFFSLMVLFASWIAYSRHTARVHVDDRNTCLKDIGFFPASNQMYVGMVGWLDPTLYYEASVTPEEVKWLDRVPSVSSIDAPSSSPLWWRLGFWLHSRSADIRYFRTSDKWPCIYAYDKKAGVIFGTVEFE